MSKEKKLEQANTHLSDIAKELIELEYLIVMRERYYECKNIQKFNPEEYYEEWCVRYDNGDYCKREDTIEKYNYWLIFYEDLEEYEEIIDDYEDDIENGFDNWKKEISKEEYEKWKLNNE